VVQGNYVGDRIYDVQGSGRSRPYKVLWVKRRSIDTALRTLDYLINALYKKYQWVQWRVHPGTVWRISRTWRKTGSRICYIKTKDLRGIRYNQTITVPTNISECNVRDFYRVVINGENSLRFNFLLGDFHVKNKPSLDYLELETFDSITLWEYEVTEITQQATLQANIAWGPQRADKGQIWAIMNRRNSASKYHFNNLLPELWRTHRTKFAIAEHGHMCDYREFKYAHQQQDRGRPMTGFYSELREVLIEFGEANPAQCERIFSNTGQCPRATRHDKCVLATGPLTLAMARPNVTPDLHNNQSILAYGRPCFLNTEGTQTNSNDTEETLKRSKRFIFALLF